MVSRSASPTGAHQPHEENDQENVGELSPLLAEPPTSESGKMLEREEAMTRYADCSFCGGEVEERQIDYDYRRRGHMLVFQNVSAVNF